MFDSQKIEKLRELKKISQKELAEKIGMTVSGYQQAFYKNEFKVSVLEKISKELDVPVSFFFDDADSQNITINSKNVNGVVNNHGTVHFNSLQEAEKEIDYLKERLAERDALIDSLQKDKDFLQHLIKAK